MIIIDGKKISQEIQNEIAAEVRKTISAGGKIPHLAAILVGNDGASETYVGGKVKACENVGFKSTFCACRIQLLKSICLKKLKS